MNNKGFAITSIIYGLMLLFVVILTSFIAILVGRSRRMDFLIEGIYEDFENIPVEEEVVEDNIILVDNNYLISGCDGGSCLNNNDIADVVIYENNPEDTIVCDYNNCWAEKNLAPGTYKLEVWGAQGGYRDYDISKYGKFIDYMGSKYGGKGGYSSGTLTLFRDTPAFVYTGGFGKTSGFNGGGKTNTDIGIFGGGASDIRLNSDNLYARVIVAGGGGSEGGPGFDAVSVNARRKTFPNYGIGMYGGGESGGTSSVTEISKSCSYSYGLGYGGLGGMQNGITAFEESWCTNITFIDSGANDIKEGSFNWKATVKSDSTTDKVAAAAGFGFGGNGITRSSGYGGAGGGGWFGGTGVYPDQRSDDDRGGGGGSGFVYTSQNEMYTSSSYIGETWLLNPSYHLTDAKTIAGNESFSDFDGFSETGHSGNGAARIIKTKKFVYNIPVVIYHNEIVSLIEDRIPLGNSVDLQDNVYVECANGGNDCSLDRIIANKRKVESTADLSSGNHDVEYIVVDSSGNKYKYVLKITVS